jgi:hypothetical protein
MHSPVEKTIRMLEKIINGERFFTMWTRTPTLKWKAIENISFSIAF